MPGPLVGLLSHRPPPRECGRMPADVAKLSGAARERVFRVPKACRFAAKGAVEKTDVQEGALVRWLDHHVA